MTREVPQKENTKGESYGNHVLCPFIIFGPRE